MSGDAVIHKSLNGALKSLQHLGRQLPRQIGLQVRDPIRQLVLFHLIDCQGVYAPVLFGFARTQLRVNVDPREPLEVQPACTVSAVAVLDTRRPTKWAVVQPRKTTPAGAAACAASRSARGGRTRSGSLPKCDRPLA